MTDANDMLAAVADIFAAGLDPRADHRWWDVVEGDGELEPFVSYQFHCPPELLDAIYGNPAYPLGS